MKKIIVTLLMIFLITVFSLGLYGGLVAFHEIPKIQDQLVILEYDLHKPPVK